MTDLYFIVRDPLYGTITHFYFGNARNAAEKMNELDLCGEIVELDYFDCDHGAFIFVGKENFLSLIISLKRRRDIIHWYTKYITPQA